MKKTLIAAAVLVACTSLHANASVITVSSAYSKAMTQTSANGYRDAVEQALLTQGTGYGTATVASYAGVSNAQLFGATSNIAWKATFDFNAAVAGTWQFRTAVDFGYGGALFLDGVALSWRATDMYTTNYNVASQFLAGTAQLSAGDHTLTIYGLENCCGGPQDAQFKFGTNNFKSFAANDGIAPKGAPKAVPEPATLASFALGLGLIGGLRRRAKRK